MTDRYATLKAWCKWKREQWAYLNRAKGFIPEEEDEDFVKDLEDLISEVGTLKARLEQFSVHGSDDCLNCDTGRITVYAKKRWCLDCQQKNPRRGS